LKAKSPLISKLLFRGEYSPNKETDYTCGKGTESRFDLPCAEDVTTFKELAQQVQGYGS